MELNITNPDAKDFPEAFGILPERQKELSRRLDEMVARWEQEAPVIVPIKIIIRDIASFCNGPEELSYCIIGHMGWHQRKGMQLTPQGIVEANNSGKMEFMIGITYSDILQLQNGAVVQVNPKDTGLVDLPITIFLGGTHEHMAKGMAKHQGAVYKFVDSHKDKKN